MKLELLQEDLNRGLSIVSRFVASRPQLPILANILLSAEKNNQLRLTATNLDIGIQYWLGAKVEEPGQLVVPAKEVSEFISYLPAGRLALATKGKLRLKITSQSGETVFSGMDPAEFPKMPTIDQKKAISLSLAELTQVVSQVAFAAANDDTRPVLTAIHWQFTSTGYQMVATDGYRLSLKTITAKGAKLVDQEKVVFLVPARSLMELVRLAGEEKEFQVGLTEDQSQVVFLLPNLQLTSRLIEGKFPEYQKIIPQEAKVRATLDKESFYQAVRVASVFARESANIVKLNLEKDKITVSANAPSVGENKTEIEAKIEGPALTIAFNYRFLLDFLNAVSEKEEEIVLEFTEALSPGVFKAKSDPSWLHIIMPVRIDL